MVETDAPLLSPEGYRKHRRNEPARVSVVGEVLAQLHGTERWKRSPASPRRELAQLVPVGRRRMSELQ